jgi:hypothetical protein
MGSGTNRTAKVLGLGLFGVICLSGIAKASDIENVFHVNLEQSDQLISSSITLGQAARGINLSVFSGDGIAADTSVTAPSISGVDLFANQAVFSLNWKAIPTAADVQTYADGAQFAQPTITTDNSTLGASVALGAQAINPETASFNPSASSINLDAIAADALTLANSAPHVDLMAKNSGIPVSSLPAIANDQVVRTVNPDRVVVTNLTPEPASLGLLGLAGLGLIARRRQSAR